MPSRKPPRARTTQLGVHAPLRTRKNFCFALAFLTLGIYSIVYGKFLVPNVAEIPLGGGLTTHRETVQLLCILGGMASVCLGVLGLVRYYSPQPSFKELSLKQKQLLGLVDAPKDKTASPPSSPLLSPNVSSRRRTPAQDHSVPSSSFSGRVRRRQFTSDLASPTSPSSSAGSGGKPGSARRYGGGSGSARRGVRTAVDRSEVVSRVGGLASQMSPMRARILDSQYAGDVNSSTAAGDVSQADSTLPPSRSGTRLRSSRAATPVRQSPYSVAGTPSVASPYTPSTSQYTPSTSQYAPSTSQGGGLNASFGAQYTLRSHRSPFGSSPYVSPAGQHQQQHRSQHQQHSQQHIMNLSRQSTPRLPPHHQAQQLMMPSVVPYATSYRQREDKPSVETSKSTLPKDPRQLDIYCAQQSDELLQKLRLEDVMDNWEMQMRLWLSERVVKPFVTDEAKNESAFDSLADKVLQRHGQTLSAEERELLTKKKPRSQFRQYLHSKLPQHLVMLERERLRQYVKVGEGIAASSRSRSAATKKEVRAYVQQRLHALAQGGYLSELKWNGGGFWKGKPWHKSRGLPSDSAILMHCFLTFMDELSSNFSKEFFVPNAEKNSDRKRDVAIVEHLVHPPYYYVKHAKGRWLPKSGRGNLFQTLLLFLYFTKTKLDGRLGAIRLDEHSLRHLNDILEE